MGRPVRYGAEDPGGRPGGIAARAEWQASFESLAPEKGADGKPVTDEQREAIYATERTLHAEHDPGAPVASCILCREPESLSILAEWIWREYFEIRREGMSGQLDRESMDYICRCNGVDEYGEQLWVRSLWHEIAGILRRARKPAAE
jgi:hypothetical protein